MKETIFISHSTPEDNDFTIWLASRLQLLGYKVWIDKSGLLGGEKFWEDIDNVIRNEAIKFLLVYSKNICVNQQAGKLKTGISKELSLAESVSNEPGKIDFRILLKLDDSAYNLYIGANEINQVPFYGNWSIGLQQLLQKLEKDNVPRSEENRDSAFGEWYENEMITKNGIVTKKELYYSNWWSVNNLPKSFFIYQFKNDKQAKSVYQKENEFPVSKISNCLSSFNSNLKTIVEHEGSTLEIIPQQIFEIQISEVLLGFEKKSFPNHRDSENHLKQLLSRVFHLIMKNRKMFWFEMANKRQAYYFTPTNLPSLKVKFQFPFRNDKIKQKTKNLLGTYQHTSHWHYAMSAKPILTPIVGFSLKNHLTFSDEGYKSWEDKDKIHTHRRRKAKASRYYNEDWRDFQCAFLNALKDHNDNIEIALNDSFNLEMTAWPEMFWADFGYYEPHDKERQGMLNDFYEDDIEDQEVID